MFQGLLCIQCSENTGQSTPHSDLKKELQTSSVIRFTLRLLTLRRGVEEGKKKGKGERRTERSGEEVEGNSWHLFRGWLPRLGYKITKLYKVSERRISKRIYSEITLLGRYRCWKSNCHRAKCSMVLPSFVRNPETRQGQNVLSKLRHKWCREQETPTISPHKCFFVCLVGPCFHPSSPSQWSGHMLDCQCSGCG